MISLISNSKSDSIKLTGLTIFDETLLITINNSWLLRSRVSHPKRFRHALVVQGDVGAVLLLRQAAGQLQDPTRRGCILRLHGGEQYIDSFFEQDVRPTFADWFEFVFDEMKTFRFFLSTVFLGLRAGFTNPQKGKN